MDLEIESIVDINYLMDIVENHSNFSYRFKALRKIIKINNFTPDYFQFFESLAISDDDNTIRAIAIVLIINNYFKLGSPLLEALIKNDSSVYVIHSILKNIEQINLDYYTQFKKIVLHRYKSLYGLVDKEAKFFMDLEHLFCTTQSTNCEIGHFKFGGSDFYYMGCFDRAVNNFNFFEVNNHVRLLSLENLKLDEIPKSIGNLMKLRKLRLSNNNLVTLPKEFENLQRLKFLDIHDNKFKEVPRVIIKLKHLKQLNLERNIISAIPEYLLEFVRKKILNKYLKYGVKKSDAELMGILEIFFGGSPLKFNDPEFPFDYMFFDKALDTWYYNIDNLGRVSGIAINYTNIQILLECISHLTYLEELYILDCKIDTFPKTFKNLTNLKKLYINECRINKIPRSFGSFQNLVELSLWSNKIKKIPKFIGELKNLKYLSLSDNLITTFRTSLCKIESLERLNVRRNQIKNVPKYMLNLKSLKEFLY